MKRIIAVILAVFLITATGCSYAEEKTEYSQIFEKDKVIDINIEIDEKDLADIREYATYEEYHSADVTVDGIKIENAGLRTKGNMTLRSIASSDSERYSYRIKFNKYVKGQKLLGLNEMVLNSCYSDPSYMREYLHYEVLRELGVNTPETVFCNVYINGELDGFYLAVEALDSSFVETEFNDPDEVGNLYKMEEGATLMYQEDENYTYAELKVGKDKEMTGFKAFVKALNEMPDGEKGDIESYLDIDSALKYIASNTVMSNYDSYNGNMSHNYYLYEDENGIFTVVPWDFNMSFGGFGGSTNIGIDTPVSGGSIDRLPMIKNLLEVPEYKERYYSYIKDTMTALADFSDRVEELKKTIQPYIEADPTAFYTIDEFLKATSASTEQEQSSETGGQPGGRGGFGSSRSIIDCVTDRLENINAQFSGEVSKETTNGADGGQPGGGGFGGRGFGVGMPQGGMQPPTGEVPQGGMEPPTSEMPQGGMEPPTGEVPQGGMESSTGEVPQGGMEPPTGEMQQGGMQPPTGERPQGGMGQRGERPQGGFGGNNESKKPEKIRVHVDGHIIDFGTDPYLEEGTTLVGYRAIMEALGAEVLWDEETQTVTAKKDDTEIVFTIGSDIAYVNGVETALLKAPIIKDDSTMIPIRFVSEQLGMKVEWEETSQLITVVSKK